MASRTVSKLARMASSSPSAAGGVGMGPVQLLDSVGEDGTHLFGTERDREIDLLDGEIRDGLAEVRRDVEVDGRHGLHGERVECGWFGARTEDGDRVGEEMTREAFGHLATSRVCDAEEEDAFGGGGHGGSPGGSTAAAGVARRRRVAAYGLVRPRT